jgi:hypothetical protein
VCDEKAGELRRGTGYVGGLEGPEIQFSMRRQPPWQGPNAPVARHDHDVADVVADAATGAGRPLGLAVILCLRSTASIAGWGSRLSATPSASGRSAHPLVAHSGRIPPRYAAFGGEGSSQRLPTTGFTTLAVTERIGTARVGKRPAGQRTPPASTRRKGGR